MNDIKLILSNLLNKLSEVLEVYHIWQFQIGTSCVAILSLLALPILWYGRRKSQRILCHQRADYWLGQDHNKSPGSLIRKKISSINEWLECRLLSGWTKTIIITWHQAWLGARPLSLLLVLAGGISLVVGLGTLLVLSNILIILCIGLVILGLSVITLARARQSRDLFHLQFPSMLDKLSDALAAGFSLTQAVDFIIPNLSDPLRSEMVQVSTRIRLGHAQKDAWDLLIDHHPSEDVLFFVEGLNLQRQVGGNLPQMMRNLAGYINQRAELSKDIRTMTAQGRLSAIVISGLVPVSLGLLAFFPGYVDVLFRTSAGNYVLLIAVILQLLGAVLVRQLIRIEV